MASDPETWVVIERDDQVLGHCYSLRISNPAPGIGPEPLGHGLRTGPWPALPNSPGFERAPEMASCFTDDNLRTDGVIDFETPYTGDGRQLDVGVVLKDSSVLSVLANRPIRVFVAGSVFVLDGPTTHDSTTISRFVIRDGRGQLRHCDDPHFNLSAGTLNCAEALGGPLPLLTPGS